MHSFSCEFFPPKTPEGMEKLRLNAVNLSLHSPDFFSVTFGAGGSTREGTIETVKMLRTHTKVSVAPHLSCMGASREDLIRVIQQYKEMKVKRIVALRGDLPSGMGQSSELRYASELVALIREIAGDTLHIEVAAYPEIHPQANSATADVMNLKRKIEAGANSAITQYFFNADAYFYYLDECVKAGIDVPIVPGILPITQFARLARFSEMCGAEIPRWIRKRLESFGDDTTSIIQFGEEVVHQLCQKLLAGGAPGLHFYTLNKAEPTYRLMQSLSVKKVLRKVAVQA